MDQKIIDKCGHCGHFITNEEDIHIIPVGQCSKKEIENLTIDFHHHPDCSSYTKKPQLVRTVNCNGCNKELWTEFECTCVRNYTGEVDKYT